MEGGREGGRGRNRKRRLGTERGWWVIERRGKGEGHGGSRKRRGRRRYIQRKEER